MGEVLHGERGLGLNWVTVEDGWEKRSCDCGRL